MLLNNREKPFPFMLLEIGEELILEAKKGK